VDTALRKHYRLWNGALKADIRCFRLLGHWHLEGTACVVGLSIDIWICKWLLICMSAFCRITTSYCRFTSTDCWVAWSWLYSYKFLEGIVAWCFCMWPASTLSISIPLLVLFPYILCHKEGQSYFNSWSCCRYTYKLGHRLSDGTHIWSKSYSFRASPYPGQDSLQRVVIFRDMGKVWFFAHLGKILCVVFISVSFSI